MRQELSTTEKNLAKSRFKVRDLECDEKEYEFAVKKVQEWRAREKAKLKEHKAVITRAQSLVEELHSTLTSTNSTAAQPPPRLPASVRDLCKPDINVEQADGTHNTDTSSPNLGVRNNGFGTATAIAAATANGTTKNTLNGITKTRSKIKDPGVNMDKRTVDGLGVGVSVQVHGVDVEVSQAGCMLPLPNGNTITGG